MCKTWRPSHNPLYSGTYESIQAKSKSRRRRFGQKNRVFYVGLLVRSKYSLTPKKLLQKVSQLILVGFSVLFNILKVYQSRTTGKVIFSRWRPRWSPKPLSDHNSVTINSNLMILVSIPRFFGAKNTLRS